MKEILAAALQKAADEVRTEQAESPQLIQRELMELTLKAARRCAHDLRHAADAITDTEQCHMFRERASMWHGIFYPDCGPKNYRAGLHQQIDDLETQVRELRAMCLKNGIDTSGIFPPF